LSQTGCARRKPPAPSGAGCPCPDPPAPLSACFSQNSPSGPRAARRSSSCRRSSSRGARENGTSKAPAGPDASALARGREPGEDAKKGRGLLVESSPLLSGEEKDVCGGGRVFRRCPTLPRPVGRSTIGAGGLSFRVRDGSGRFPSAVTTGTPHHPHQPGCPGCGVGCVVAGICTVDANRISVSLRRFVCRVHTPACRDCLTCVWASPRPISTSPLNALRRLHVWPINPLVWWGP
jgi:hypothetical protein